MEHCDAVIDTVLTSFAVDIIKAVSKKTKIHPTTLALAVPGLVHSHWFVTDEPIQGCLYCERVTKLSK